MDNCSEGEPYLHNVAFPSILVVQLFISVIAILTNWAVIKSARNDSYYHVNIRIIVGAAIIMNIIHSLIIGILMALHAFLMFGALNACSILLPASFCISMRIPTNIALISQTALNTTLAVERILATVKSSKYERIGWWLGALMVTVSIFCGVALTYAMMHKTPWDARYAYCTIPNNFTAEDVNVVLGSMAIWELLVILTISVLYFYNRRLQSRKSYKLGRSFQLSENIYVSRLLLPWMLAHFGLHTFFYSGGYLIPVITKTTEGVLAKTLYLIFYVIPFQCMVSPVILWYIRKKQKQERADSLMNITVEPPGKKHNYVDLWN